MLSQFEHYSPSIRRLVMAQSFSLLRGRHPRGPDLNQSIINVASQLHEIDGVVDVRDGYMAQAASSGQSRQCADQGEVRLVPERRAGAG